MIDYLEVKLNIRQEAKEDFGTIHALVKSAFETALMSQGDEQDYVDHIRAGDTYIPELSLIAEKDGLIVGHIMLATTKVHDGDKTHDFLVLAILSVAEQHRCSGLGTALVYVALDRARRMGYTAVFLAGNRDYYSRFGFVPASRFGIRYKEDVPADLLDNIMALELVPGALDGISGIVDL